VPGTAGSSAQEVGVVVLKDGGLLGVGVTLHTIDNKSRDRVAAKATGSRGMEEFSVLVPLKGETNLSPGFPVNRALPDSKVEGVHGERAEAIFSKRERAPFF
jgi:hypothetical protein